MLTESAKKILKRQSYEVVGEHSAVKTCGWTKSMLRGDGGCYKLKFYGVLSHQCMQMTPSMACADRCTFCWRDYKAPVSKSWQGKIDEPEFVIEKSLKAHHKLLTGFNKHKNGKDKLYESSKDVKHVALSLTGEPINYPKINEMIDKFHAKGISTFLVTNAQYPNEIKNLKPITQLYISLDAPNKKLLKEIDQPIFSDFWERLLKSLDYLKKKRQRTCIRLTLIKDINMNCLDGYTNLIKQGDSDFIEAKGYIHVGASIHRLKKSNMPYHEDVIEFSKKLLEHLGGYEIVSEQISSRVVLLAKKKFKKNGKWFTWIDYPKFNKLVLSGKEFSTEDYMKETPKNFVGLSGTGTLDRMDKKFKHGLTLRQLIERDKQGE